MRRSFTIFSTFLSFFIASLVAQPSLVFTEVDLVNGPLVQPVDITGSGDGTNRLFIAEKRGTIRIIEGNEIQNPAFLDIQDKVMNNGERGLLGLTFHPEFPDSPYFYVNYVIESTITNRISRFTVNPNNPFDAIDTSELIFLEIPGIQSNHKAGDIAFGPDGYLYIGTGDGGGGGDPGEEGQDIESLLGKILRIDVDAKSPPLNYSIPAGNPFVGVAGRDEIYHYGIRNPWRISFDALTGDMWIADVGQNQWEEINWVYAESEPGQNFGWDCHEGNHNFESSGCSGSDYTWPVFEYPHNCNPCPNGQGLSLTGGFVYRGAEYPNLYGYYVCADYGSSWTWLIRQINDTPPEWEVIPAEDDDQIAEIVSFGEDDNGELYASSLNGTFYSVGAIGGLPVAWEDIEAFRVDIGNEIRWVLHHVNSIESFEVQRSQHREFTDYVVAATVEPIENQMHYAYTDILNFYDGVYYRIAARLNDQSVEYSPVVRILANPVSKPSLIFDHGTQMWRLMLPDPWNNGDLVVYDVQGRAVYKQKLSAQENFDLKPSIIPGSYFVRINSESGTWSEKFVR